MKTDALFEREELERVAWERDFCGGSPRRLPPSEPTRARRQLSQRPSPRSEPWIAALDIAEEQTAGVAGQIAGTLRRSIQTRHRVSCRRTRCQAYRRRPSAAHHQPETDKNSRMLSLMSLGSINPTVRRRGREQRFELPDQFGMRRVATSQMRSWLISPVLMGQHVALRDDLLRGNLQMLHFERRRHKTGGFPDDLDSAFHGKLQLAVTEVSLKRHVNRERPNSACRVEHVPHVARVAISRCIHEVSGLKNGSAPIRVPEGRLLDEIHRPSEQGGQVILNRHEIKRVQPASGSNDTSTSTSLSARKSVRTMDPKTDISVIFHRRQKSAMRSSDTDRCGIAKNLRPGALWHSSRPTHGGTSCKAAQWFAVIFGREKLRSASRRVSFRVSLRWQSLKIEANGRRKTTESENDKSLGS